MKKQGRPTKSTEDQKQSITIRLNAIHIKQFKELGGVRWLRQVLDKKEFVEAVANELICPHCGEIKEPSQMDARGKYCRACRSIKASEWAKNNPHIAGWYTVKKLVPIYIQALQDNGFIYANMFRKEYVGKSANIPFAKFIRLFECYFDLDETAQIDLINTAKIYKLKDGYKIADLEAAIEAKRIEIEGE